MFQLLTIIGIIVIILLFCKFEWGICAFVAYLFLIPTQTIYIEGWRLTSTVLHLIVFSLFLFNLMKKKKIDKISYRFVYPFILLYILLALLIPIQINTMPFVLMINIWRQNIMDSVLIAIIITNLPLIAKSYGLNMGYTLMICMLIISVYGLFQISLQGINPYIIAYSEFSGVEFNESYALGDNGGRMFGRISSLFIHPMTLGFFLSQSVVFLLFMMKKVPHFSIYLIISLVIILSIVHGVRTTIATEIVCVCYLLISYKKVRYIIWTILGAYFMMMILSVLDSDAYNYVLAMLGMGSEASSIEGSSVELRVNQMLGAFDAIGSNFLIGNGYGWNQYYQVMHGDHPVLLAFESLLFVILCNHGILGLIIYATVFVKLFQNNKRLFGEDKIYANAFLIGYLVYSLLTGEYGYLKYMIIFYAVFCLISQYKNGKSSSNSFLSPSISSIQRKR